MKNILDLDGPLVRALSDLNTLVILNILTALFCSGNALCDHGDV